MKNRWLILLPLLGLAHLAFAQAPVASVEAARRDLFPVRAGAFLDPAPAHDDLLAAGSADRKSVGLAALYSLLLPGMGELYVGNYGMGKYFTIAEGAFWVGLIGVDRYATALQDDSRRYAAVHAGTAFDGKDDQYFIDISNFNTVYAYNEQVLRDRDPEKLYDPQSTDYWSWDTDANRNTFRDQRVSADKMFNNTRFIVAAIAVNHVVSAINAARLAFTNNRNLDQAGTIDVRAGLLGTLSHPDGLQVTVSRRF
jgi:hypothetical protein